VIYNSLIQNWSYKANKTWQKDAIHKEYALQQLHMMTTNDDAYSGQRQGVLRNGCSSWSSNHGAYSNSGSSWLLYDNAANWLRRYGGCTQLDR